MSVSNQSFATTGWFLLANRCLANSALVSHIDFGYGSMVMTTDMQYDNLNRLTRIQSGTGVSPVVDFRYGYSAANQRTNITLGPDNSHWDIDYDSLGQVTSGQKHWPDATLVAGLKRGQPIV